MGGLIRSTFPVARHVNLIIWLLLFAACDLLGNFMEQINKDHHKAFKIYQTACDEYKFGHSCQRVGSYYFAGKTVEKDVVNVHIMYNHMGTNPTNIYHISYLIYRDNITSLFYYECF